MYQRIFIFFYVLYFRITQAWNRFFYDLACKADSDYFLFTLMLKGLVYEPCIFCERMYVWHHEGNHKICDICIHEITYWRCIECNSQMIICPDQKYTHAEVDYCEECRKKESLSVELKNLDHPVKFIYIHKERKYKYKCIDPSPAMINNSNGKILTKEVQFNIPPK